MVRRLGLLLVAIEAQDKSLHQSLVEYLDLLGYLVDLKVTHSLGDNLCQH
jgi:hypothetical protein